MDCLLPFRRLAFLAALLRFADFTIAADAPKPNILWLIAEDFGQHLGCYGVKEVNTPHLDKLAADGVRYTRFFNGHVCSPSRSAFNTGMYATSIGAHHHRTTNKQPLPEGVKILSDWMRQAGYFTANVRQLPAPCGFKGTGKTDWNFKYEGKPFDTDQWSELKGHQPFYAQINFSETHRGFSARPKADPAKVEIPPYYPDHPVTREDWAKYLDEASELDRKIGLVLEALDQEGLAANTIVVFFGDNGQSHVRGKQFCYEEGQLVPLIIRWPKTIPPPSRFQAGTVDQRLLHGIDLAPTMLALANAPKPPKMQGQIFLGDRCEPDRHYVFGYRDRCDMTVMRLRTVRDERYRYIRNFTPWVPFLAFNEYKQKQYPVWNLLQDLHAQGKLTPAQELLCQPTMPEEELYDLHADPWETNNLAKPAKPEHEAQLKKLHAVLERWIEDTQDQGRRLETLEELKKADARFVPERDWRPTPGSKEAADAKALRTSTQDHLAAERALRPNVLWITAEDLSPNLGCYGDPYARTPNLDALAREGVRYTSAFATAPVCSPARSCLITGLYATSLGTQRLRSQFPVPKEVRGFPALLREAGYYTANNAKTDYNLRDEPAFIRDCWDECSPRAHWRGRRPGQPFFAVFNLMTTHQSRTSVWPQEQFEKEIGAKLAPEERHDPAHAPLPPYYPDTLEARGAWARYHDCITAMDKEAGDLLRQLAHDGLADDTIVFFYGDNGMGLPRGKRCLWDTGLREPLLVRFPEKYRRLAPAVPGTTTDRLVSFVDFAPAMLSLCGVKAPAHMQGVAFLGEAAGKPRAFVFGARDRVDEVFELSRSVRDQRFLYIRNFMPHVSWMQPEGYSDASTFRRELQRLAAGGKLNPAQLAYAAPRKSPEELYDTEADPHQLYNLAAVPAHQAILERMQRVLREGLLATRDAGFLTEPQVWERIPAAGTPIDLARDDANYPLARLLDAAGLVGRLQAVPQQVQLLRDADEGVRYWAAVGLHAAGNAGASARAALRGALKDTSAVVRVEAAAALVELGETTDPLRILEQELRSTQPDIALHAARALQLLARRSQPVWPAMREVCERARREEKTAGDPAMYLRFSLESALSQP